MIKKIYIYYFVLLMFASMNSKAAHIVGGEMSYRLIDTVNFTYAIKLALYRDCAGFGAVFDNPARIDYFDINNNLLFSRNILHVPITNLDPSGNDPCLIVPPGVCVQETFYFDTLNLPPIVGGYQIAYQRYARNNSIINLVGPGNTGSVFMATIPDTALVKYNSSPEYINFPPIAICLGKDLDFDHVAFDADGDSLVYELCTPLNVKTLTPIPPAGPPNVPPFPVVTYIGPFTFDDPMGSPIFLDTSTGRLTATPDQIGKFVVGVCVKEYRDDTILSVHSRDFQFNVVDCINPSAAVFQFERICGDSTVFFPDSSTGASSYWWDFGDPSTTTDTSISNAPTYIYPDTGVFQVTLIVNKGSACSDTATGTLELRPGIHPNYTFTGMCIADSIHFADSSFVDAGSLVSWYWDFGDGDTANALTPVHYYTNPDTYQVQLTIISNFVCVDSITKTIIVDTFTIADIGPDFSLCGDSIIAFDNFSKGAKSYFWDFGVPLVMSDTSIMYEPTYTYSDTGLFQIMLITNSACNTDTDYMDLGVLDGITAGFDFNPVCLGNTTIFTNTSNSNSSDSIVNYEWDFDNGDNSFAMDTSYLYLGANTYQVKLRIASSLGCTDSITKAVAVYSLPQAILPSLLTQCGINLPMTFVDSSINSDSYNWDFGDLFTNADTSNIQMPSYTYPDSGSYVVRLITGAGGQCFDTTFMAITIKPGANAQFNFDFVCLNDTVLITNNSNVEAGQLIAWEWDFGDGTNSSNQNPNQHFYDNSGNYLIRLIVTSDKNCKDTLGSLVTVFELPVYDLGNDTTICYKAGLRLNVPDSVAYYWGNTGCSALPTEELTPIVNDKYFILASADTTLFITACDTNGCEFTDMINIFVNPLPIIIATPDEVAITRGTDVQFDATGGEDYVWTPNDYFISNPNISNPIVNPFSDTIYYVFGTGVNGCINYDSVIIDILLFPELHIPSAFTPDDDGLNDVFKYFYYDLKSLIYFRIYNRYGQKVFESNSLGDFWDGKFKNKDQEVGTYVYYLEVETLENKILRKQGNIALIR